MPPASHGRGDIDVTRPPARGRSIANDDELCAGQENTCARLDGMQDAPFAPEPPDAVRVFFVTTDGLCRLFLHFRGEATTSTGVNRVEDP